MNDDERRASAIEYARHQIEMHGWAVCACGQMFDGDGTGYADHVMQCEAVWRTAGARGQGVPDFLRD